MMIIKAFYIGNSSEAFIERNFSEGLNIVFSDDNHVGKSVVMQGIMYALGGDPLFSSTLNYRNYYFVVDFDVNGESYSVMRQRDSFAVKHGNNLFPFDTVSEFRRYWNSKVFPLPSIIHNGEDHIVYLSLFNQMYFTSQSDRSSAQIFNPGMYNKNDFIEMLYSIVGLAGRNLPEDEEEALKTERTELRAIRDRLIRQSSTYNTGDPALSIISPVADETSRAESVQAFEKLTAEITELRKTRNRLYSRMKKNDATLKELRSLNQSMSVGQLVCLDCGSQQIGLELADSKMVFDVTTTELRNQIIKSLKEKIDSYAEEIESIVEKIRHKQSTLSGLLEEKDITIEDVILYREDYKGLSEIDSELEKTKKRLGEIESLLRSNNSQERNIRELRSEFMATVLSTMNEAHNQLCLGEEHANYEKLFTSAAQALTGSELTEYILSRAYALEKCIHHRCPIIVDSFRAEDLSSAREEKALQLFSTLGNQVIFTTTIKDEEHDKYESFPFVKAIDYSGFETNKILQPDYLEEFFEIVDGFGVVLGE